MTDFLEKPLKYVELKRLSLSRIREAKILFDRKNYSGAYYIAGYSVELALKACYCKDVDAKSFAPNKDIHRVLYSHRLEELRKVSFKGKEFIDLLDKNDYLKANWQIVKNWSENSRYSFKKKKDAEEFIDALTSKNGVLTALKKIW